MPPERSRVRVALCDDEPMARASLRRLLARDPEVELVAECVDGEDLVARTRELRPDLLFLDVQMPGKDGFDALAALAPDERPLVVFATAYDQFALRAFEVHAIDYLLKPFDDERFQAALDRAKALLGRDAAVEEGRRLDELLDDVRPNGGPRRLAIHREGRVDYVDHDDIVWVEAADQYVLLHTADGEHLMRESMSRLEQELDPERFHRIHRSAIVALDRVRRLERGEGGTRVLVGDDTWLPVSRSRAAALRRRLG